MKGITLLILGFLVGAGVVIGQPVDFPSQEAFRIEFDTTAMSLSSVWQSDGHLFCLVHLANRVTLIEDGEIIWHSPIYTALRNASMTKFGNEYEILVLSDSVSRSWNGLETFSRTDVYSGEDLRLLYRWPCGYSIWNGGDGGGENPNALFGFAHPQSDSLKRIALYYYASEFGYGPDGSGWSWTSGYLKRLSLVNGVISERINTGTIQTVLFDDIDGDEYTDLIYAGVHTSQSNWYAEFNYSFRLTIGSLSSELSIEMRDTLEYSSGPEEPSYFQVYQFLLYRPQVEPTTLWASKYGTRNVFAEFSVADLSVENEVIWPNRGPGGHFLTQFQQPTNEQYDSYILIADANGNIGRFDAETNRFLGDYYNYGSILRSIKSVDIEGDGHSELLVLTPEYLALLNVENLSVEIAHEPTIPTLLSLSAFPNPFNSSTSIYYSLPARGRYAIDVVDLQGRLVTRLSDGWKEAGSYREMWDAGQIGQGTYFARIRQYDQGKSVPILFIK